MKNRKIGNETNYTKGILVLRQQNTSHLDALLVRRHESVSRFDSFRDFWIMKLKEETELVCVGVALFDHLVAGSTDCDDLLLHNTNSLLLLPKKSS